MISYVIVLKLTMWKTNRELFFQPHSGTVLSKLKNTLSLTHFLKNLICTRFVDEISQYFVCFKVKLERLYLFIFNYVHWNLYARKFYFFVLPRCDPHSNLIFHDLRLLPSQPCLTRSLPYYHKLAVALKWSVL